MVRIPRSDEIPEDPDHLEPETPEEKDLVAEIDGWLVGHRPERYDDNFDWHESFTTRGLERLAAVPADIKDRDYLRRLMRTREGVQAQQAKKTLIKISDTDQLALEWDTEDIRRDILRWPLIIEGARIRFGAVTAADLNAWILESVRRSDDRNLREKKARDGASRLMKWLKNRSADRVEDLRDWKD